MRTFVKVAAVGAMLGSFAVVAEVITPVNSSVFNGKNLTGWRLRHEKLSEKSKWTVVSEAALDKAQPDRLAGEKGEGILLNGGDGRGVDLLTERPHGDCRLQLEFNIAKGSNSGVYFQGQYEVQILDSFGKKDSELKYGDCGGIYNTAAPRTNASRAPGEWQTFDIVFRAPRFDSAGVKTADAIFVTVIHNGTVIHENVSVKKPTTASLGGPEKPMGPLMLQGDHGPVAFRNIRLNAIDRK